MDPMGIAIQQKSSCQKQIIVFVMRLKISQAVHINIWAVARLAKDCTAQLYVLGSKGLNSHCVHMVGMVINLIVGV